MSSTSDSSNKFDILLSDYQNIITVEKGADNLLLEEYQVSIGEIERLYIKSPPTRPRQLTIPEIFHRSYDENFISDYLAYVLDPAINGIGIEPLSALLQQIFPEIEEPDIEDVEIIREYDVGGGRIDFLLRFGESTILGIENKVFSPEGNKQTNYYAQRIKSLFPDLDCFFIFLTPDGAKASSREFRSVSYSQVWQLLRSVQYDWQSDVRKSILWEDFLTHLEVYIMGQREFEFSPRAKLFIDNYEMMVDLQKAFNQDWQKFIGMIESKLHSHLPGVNWRTSFNPTRYHWHQIVNSNWGYPNLSIHYEYHFSPNSLSKSELAFMFEAEGKAAKNFISLFVKNLPLINDTYKKFEIHFSPGNRKHAVAYKKYKYENPPDSWDIEFIKAYDEFSFLNDYIDKTIQEMKSIDVKS